MVANRTLDLCILIAKYNIFVSKLHGTSHTYICFKIFLKNRTVLEKYNTLNGRANKFHADWML